MRTDLTALEIVGRVKAELLPHRAEARVWDYGGKIDVKVWRSDDGSHLFNMRGLLVRELCEEDYLNDAIRCWRHEIKKKIKCKSNHLNEGANGE